MLPVVPLSVRLSRERRWLSPAAPKARSCPSPCHPPWERSRSGSVGSGERPSGTADPGTETGVRLHPQTGTGWAARSGCRRKRNCSTMRKDTGWPGLSGDGSAVVVRAGREAGDRHGVAAPAPDRARVWGRSVVPVSLWHSVPIIPARCLPLRVLPQPRVCGRVLITPGEDGEVEMVPFVMGLGAPVALPFCLEGSTLKDETFWKLSLLRVLMALSGFHGKAKIVQ